MVLVWVGQVEALSYLLLCIFHILSPLMCIPSQPWRSACRRAMLVDVAPPLYNTHSLEGFISSHCWTFKFKTFIKSLLLNFELKLPLPPPPLWLHQSWHNTNKPSFPDENSISHQVPLLNLSFRLCKQTSLQQRGVISEGGGKDPTSEY